MDLPYSTEELIIVSIAREIKDGFLVVEGINTTLPTAAYRLARLTHAPRATFLSLAGNVYVNDPLKLCFALEEEEALNHSIGLQGSAVPPLYTTYRHDFEMLRSAQIDRFGNVNSTVIGDYSAPKVRLPGISGVLDVYSLCNRLKLYFPRHTRRIFVEEVDFVSALGYGDGSAQARAEMLGSGPYKVITSLGIFGFDQETKAMKLLSLHPGVTEDDVRQNTSFEIIIPEAVSKTEPPSEQEAELIRTRIDPLGLRDIESVTGAERLAVLRRILEREKELLDTGEWKAPIEQTTNDE